MKNIFVLGALVLALGLIGYLYQQLTTTQKALQQSEQRFADCQKVTFQLQNQLAPLQKKQLGGVPQ
jgi:type II secretory pathway component PulJ